MTFELLPTIDVMFNLYEKPVSIGRFQNYVKTLHNDAGDLAMPISGFNPMAKEHLLLRLQELRDINAEVIVEKILSDLNTRCIQSENKRLYKVALNLSDDIKGGWTNRYTSDYDSKFKINALINRGFITPILWSGEPFTSDLIIRRTLEYVYRTVAWMIAPKPKTLKEHIEQEKFVVEHTEIDYPKKTIDFNAMAAFSKKNWNDDSYHIIFNFFYGDDASKSLEFPSHGIKGKMPGFEYVKQLVKMEVDSK